MLFSFCRLVSFQMVFANVQAKLLTIKTWGENITLLVELYGVGENFFSSTNGVEQQQQQLHLFNKFIRWYFNLKSVSLKNRDPYARKWNFSHISLNSLHCFPFHIILSVYVFFLYFSCVHVKCECGCVWIPRTLNCLQQDKRVSTFSRSPSNRGVVPSVISTHNFSCSLSDTIYYYFQINFT